MHRNAILLIAALFIIASRPAFAADSYTPFDGQKTAWHDGFDRHDFVMDEATLAITPFKAPEGEKFGVRDPPRGQPRCIGIVPKKTAAARPWPGTGCVWVQQPRPT